MQLISGVTAGFDFCKTKGTNTEPKSRHTQAAIYGHKNRIHTFERVLRRPTEQPVR